MLELIGAVSLVAAVLFAVALYAGFFRLTIPLRGWVHELAHPIAPARLRPDVSSMTDEKVSVAWIGHATCLINFYGTWILTDPVFSDRVGIQTPFGVLGSRRMIEPALSIGDLPRLDLVVITHAHMDHFDPPSLERLPKDAELITPTGFSDLAAGLGFEKVREAAWNSRIEAGGVEIFAFAPRHWGNRTPWEKADRRYNSYLFKKNGRTILLAGDTGYTGVFGEVAKTSRIDAAIFDLGAYRPEWFRKNHATSEDIWKMYKQTGAPVLLPVHWGTFINSQEPVEDPMNWLRAAAGDEFYDRVGIFYQGEVWSMK